MKESMKDGMDEMHNMQMTGDVDRGFAMMMKMHHQKGLEMAKMELANGKSPTMKAMAKKIITVKKKKLPNLIDGQLNTNKSQISKPCTQR